MIPKKRFIFYSILDQYMTWFMTHVCIHEKSKGKNYIKA